MHDSCAVMWFDETEVKCEVNSCNEAEVATSTANPCPCNVSATNGTNGSNATTITDVASCLRTWHSKALKKAFGRHWSY